MKSISLGIYRISKGWVALSALAVMIAFSIIVLPGQKTLSETYSNGSGSPDTSFIYSSSQLYQMAGQYGVAGRQQYLHARWTFDLVFPLVYTLFLITTISWTFDKFLQPDSNLRLLNLIPIAAMLVDFLENSMTSVVFSRFPLKSMVFASAATIFTPLKWILVLVSFTILIAAMLCLLVRLLKKGHGT